MESVKRSKCRIVAWSTTLVFNQTPLTKPLCLIVCLMKQPYQTNPYHQSAALTASEPRPVENHILIMQALNL